MRRARNLLRTGDCPQVGFWEITFEEAHFGIIIHWGVCSVPSFAPPPAKGQTPYADWYWNSLQSGKPATVEFHNRTYGPNFSYAQFAPIFKAEFWTLQDIHVSNAAQVTALGTNSPLKWDREANGIRIHLPLSGGPEAIRLTNAN